MKITMTRVAVLVLSISLVGTLAACGPHYFKASAAERAEYVVEKISKKMELNEDQKAKLDILKTEILSLRNEMHSKREQTIQAVNEILEQNTLDQDRVLEMLNNKTQVINNQAPQVVAALGGFYDSLTAEQQQKLREEFKERMEYHGKYWGHN